MQVLRRSDVSKSSVLSGLKQTALNDVAAAVSGVRGQFVTSIAGQDLVYIEKERQAVEFLNSVPEPDMNDAVVRQRFSFVFSEVGITGETPYQVATVIAFMAARWRQVGPEIEALRLTASAAISGASGRAEIEAALSDLFAALSAVSNE